MAKHRAPAQIEIASTVERTWLHEFVDRYWRIGVGLAVAITAGILFNQWRATSAERGHEEGWNRLAEEVQFNALLGAGPLTTPSPAVLGSLAEELGTKPAASWARAIAIGKHLENEDYTAARAALEELAADWPDHPLVTEALYPAPDDGPPRTLARHLEDRARALEQWEAAHPLLFENPPLPEDAPRVRLNTGLGPVVIGLYSDRAPKHAENFLARCREGYYDGTLFHRVIAGRMIQGGDPNTRDGDPETWGQGGPDETVPAEIDPQLRHFAGVVAAARKPSDKDSSGSQFYVTTHPYHGWDGQYTVFGRVLEGLSTVEAIANAAAEGERPTEPVTLESTEILE